LLRKPMTSFASNHPATFALYYADFSQTSDAEVIDLLERQRAMQSPGARATGRSRYCPQ
jgi:predicted phosphoribosyltransferase